MKKQLTCLVLLPLLISCSEVKEFKEPRKTLSAIPTASNELSQTLKDKCLENNFGVENGLYSPIGSRLIEQYKKDDAGFNELYAMMNVETNDLVLKDTFATAATKGLKDNGKFRDMVATFEGTRDELNQKIKDYFKVTVDTVVDPGLYYYSYFYLKDSFPMICSEVENLSFNGSGSYKYVSYYRNGKYFENEDMAMVELALSATAFRVLMPKEGKTVNPNVIFNQEMASGFLDVQIPKFELRTDSTKGVEDGSAERQINQFRFDKNGVYGTSFTYSAPTSDGKEKTVDFEFRFDKTFYFASMAGDMPLFYGQVAEL